MTTPDATANPVLEVRDLSVDFAVDRRWVPAAINLSYEVHAGEVLAIVGESGSGKSVSSMAILDLLPRNARVRGSIRLRGTELRDLSASRMRRIRGDDIAMIFQEPMTALNPVYTVGDQVAEVLQLKQGLSARQAWDGAVEALAATGIPEPQRRARSYPHQLSGGQRQRAMIAMGLALDPELIIADEPTTALDVTVQAEVLKLLRDIRDSRNTAIMFITHELGIVAELCDWVYVMNRGQVVEHGSVERIFTTPVADYTRMLLDATPTIRGSRQEPSDG